MAENLALELVVGAGLGVATVIIHGVGLVLLARLLRVEERAEESSHIPPLSVRGAVVTIAIVLGLFVLHGSEIWLYAWVYHLLGAVSDFRMALYFSTITYAAIGFDSEPLNPDWRMLAGIEGINGLILLGWSTAFFVTVMGRIQRL